MKKTLASGIELDITMAPFEQGHKLFQSVLKELRNVEISMGMKGKTFKELMTVDVTEDVLNTVKNIVSQLIASNEVQTAMVPCLQRATYGNVKIDNISEVFEDEKSRGDYVEVFKEVMVYNLTPFTKSLISGLNTLFGNLNIEDQKPSSKE